MNDAITIGLLLGSLAALTAIIVYVNGSNPFTYPKLGPPLLGKDFALFLLTAFFGFRRLAVGPAPISTSLGIIALVVVLFVAAIEIGSIIGYSWANVKGARMEREEADAQRDRERGTPNG